MTPTQQVSKNAQEFLGEGQNVLLAMRVVWGADIANLNDVSRLSHLTRAWSPVIFPMVAMARLRSSWDRMRSGSEAHYGVLVLVSSGDSILLTATPRWRKQPTGIVEVLSPDAELKVNVDLMEEILVPLIKIGHHELVVNGIDFRALLKALKSGVVKSPSLEADLDRLEAAGGTPWG